MTFLPENKGGRQYTEADVTAVVDQAVELFDRQKYQEAFEMFVKACRQCQDLTEQQKIFQMLEDLLFSECGRIAANI